MTDQRRPNRPSSITPKPTLEEARSNAKALVNGLDPKQSPTSPKPDRNTILQERNQEYRRGMSLIRSDHEARRAAFDRAAKEQHLLARVAFDKELDQELKDYQSSFEEFWPENLSE